MVQALLQATLKVRFQSALSSQSQNYNGLYFFKFVSFFYFKCHKYFISGTVPNTNFVNPTGIM